VLKPTRHVVWEFTLGYSRRLVSVPEKDCVTYLMHVFRYVASAASC